MVVGRFRGGTPVLLSASDDPQMAKDNDFSFQGDGLAKCPLHAHMRKTNARHDSGRHRRIARRGIPYDDRDPSARADELPTGGVGLLFACFQSNIDEQFAFIQRSWANKAEFPIGGTGQDPLIANPPANGGAPAQRWPTVWGGAEMKSFDFGHFVTMKGGEYFFAPSIPFLTHA
jgi:deferrochelatase/peroxidase EfeB